MAQAKRVKPFLRQVASYLLSRYPERIDEEVLVLPSRRAARFIQRYLGIEAGGRIWSPRVLTLDDFIHQSHPEAAADPIATYFELYDVYANILGSDASRFESFIKWGRTLLQDLDEVDRYMIPPEKLFSDLRKIKEIEDWSFRTEDLSPYQEHYLNLWMKLEPIHRGLKESLSSKGRVLKGEAYRRLGEEPQLAEGWSPRGKVHFIGLNALSKAEERLVAHLVKEGKAELHFDSDPYYMEDPTQEAGHFLRYYRSTDWGKDGFGYDSGPMGGEGRKIHTIGVNGKVSQAKLAGRILEKEGVPDDGLHTAVVLSDESLLQPVLHSLPSSTGDLNVTMGSPLDRTALHAFFRDLLRMHRHYHRSPVGGVGRAYYHRDLVRVLEHPYVDGLFQDRTGVSSRDPVERIKQGNSSFMSREGVMESIRASQKDLKEVPDPIQTLFEPLENIPEDVIGVQEKLLQAFQEAMLERGDELDRENFYEYAKVLKRIRSLFQEGHRVRTIEAYERILGQVVEGEELSFIGEPLQGVQVMGMLETRAIDMSHIILLSANESVLPKGSSEASLIPHDLRVYYKMPTRHEKDAVFAYHFYRMIQRADRADLIYDTDPDGAGSGEKSRYLTQLLHEMPRKDPSTDLQRISAHVPLQHHKEEALSIPKDEQILAQLKEWASKGVSPTALSTWVEDPYTFYRRYVLRLPEPEELSESIDARALGDLIHHVLHELYQPYEGMELPSSDIPSLEKKVGALVRKHFRAHYHEKDIDSGKNHIMLRVIEERVARFLQMEKSWVEKAEAAGDRLFIESLEQPFSTDISIDVGGERVPIRLVGTADRIDRIGGKIRLIDLKTGRVDPSKLKIGDPKELFEEPGSKYALQLLFYGLIYLKGSEVDPERVEPSIIGFQELGKGSMGLKPKKGSAYASLSEQLEAFEEGLRECMAGILDPERPIVERSEKQPDQASGSGSSSS